MAKLECDKCLYTCVSNPTMKRHKEKMHRYTVRTRRESVTAKGIIKEISQARRENASAKGITKARKAIKVTNKSLAVKPMVIDLVDKTDILNLSIIPTMDEDFPEHKELEDILKNIQETAINTVESEKASKFLIKLKKKRH